VLTAAWRFRRFLRPHRVPLAGGAVLVVAGILADLAQPWPLKVIIDGAITHKPQQSWLAHLIQGPARAPESILLRALAVLVVLVAVSAALAFLSDYLMSGAGQRVMMDVRNELFAHMQRLSLSYHTRQRVGDLTSRLSGDMNRLQDMLVAIFDTFIPNVVMLFGLASVMLVVDPGFGLLALSIAPFLFFVTYRYTQRIRRASRDAREAEVDLAAHANETLSSILAVQAFSREAYEDRRFAARSHEALGAGLLAIKLKASFTPMVDVVSIGGTVIVMYFGVRRVLDGTMTLGLLLVFLAYLASLYKPMRALSKLAYLVSRGTVSAERVLEALEVDERVPERPGAIAVRLRGGIEFRDVTFRYADDREPVLRHVSLRVEPGEHIGIVGPTGAGKSTFVSLIPRFYDAEAGTVLVDGIDVRDFELASLRSQVTLVLQEPVLFHGTILDNIRYGVPEASVDEVLEVAEAAHVTEFLAELPNGLLTDIGERGATLSGGQRQRIAIARALLRDSPIVILDEPTTGLDAESELLVLEGLSRLCRDRTTFVISHKPAPLAGLHRVLVVGGAVVAEQPVGQRRSAPPSVRRGRRAPSHNV
jgi:subfamily B ATP-binding cassette protein MsbA